MVRALYLIGMAIAAAGGQAEAADQQQPICADRPSKSTGACTVPQGKWQIETGLIDWSRDASGGVTTEMTTLGSSAVKYGISDSADVELWLTPLERMTMYGSGLDERHSGFGDTLVRVKYKLTAGDAPIQVALDPFVKIPTANHLFGNGKVEAGMLVPVAIAFGKGPLTLTLDPELDWLADEDGHGRHAATQQVVNLAAQLSDKLTVSGELWAKWDWDRSRTTRQASADAAAAYMPNDDLQIDTGANFGLNNATPAIELYAGVSKRF